MFKLKVFKRLIEWDKKGKYVFTTQELREIFGCISKNSFDNHIKSFVENNILVRAYRGVYVNPDADCWDGYAIEHIANALRHGHYNYVSLESMLSEYGVISQIPIDRITVVTTGEKGEFRTPYGTIEFTQTNRGLSRIKEGVHKIDNRPLPIASKETAYRDLRRIGRNLHLVNLNELSDKS